MDVSIIIFCVYFFLELLEGGEINESVFEGDGDIVVVSEKLHDLFLSASFKSRDVAKLETQVLFVYLRPSLVLLLAHCTLILYSHLSEEVISVEQPIGPHSPRPKPEWPHSPQPPRVGFLNEVGVVKHVQ